MNIDQRVGVVVEKIVIEDDAGINVGRAARGHLKYVVVINRGTARGLYVARGLVVKHTRDQVIENRAVIEAQVIVNGRGVVKGPRIVDRDIVDNAFDRTPNIVRHGHRRDRRDI